MSNPPKPLEHHPRRPFPRKAASPESTSHRVRDGESWATLAERYGIAAQDIIQFNFGRTTGPKEVNWYLREHVGCNRATLGGKNWMFSSGLKPGVVQIPPKTYTFDDDEIIEAAPRFYRVKVEPSRWEPPAALVDPGSAKSVDKSGQIFEGRPLEVMGSNAGVGKKSGPLFDPDFGAVGIVLQGVYQSRMSSDPPKQQLKSVWFSSDPPLVRLWSLEMLVRGLRTRYPLIRRLQLHKEVEHKGEPTVCPGDLLEGKVVEMRKRLKMTP